MTASDRVRDIVALVFYDVFGDHSARDEPPLRLIDEAGGLFDPIDLLLEWRSHSRPRSQSGRLCVQFPMRYENIKIAV